jgi:hypothetical protein
MRSLPGRWQASNWQMAKNQDRLCNASNQATQDHNSGVSPNVLQRYNRPYEVMPSFRSETRGAIRRQEVQRAASLFHATVLKNAP